MSPTCNVPAFSLCLGIAMSVLGCATPIPPTGGPEDTTPPALVSSFPEHEAVLVSTDRVTLTFSEHLEPASVARAVSVTPGLETPPDIQPRGREIVVRLNDVLRSNTTYLLSLSTDLRDNHGVAIQEPITIAFSTGATIDRGRLNGTVRDPMSGELKSGIAVLALPHPPGNELPDPTQNQAEYQSETGTDGRFSLSHIHPGPYFVYALRDLNRNGLADDEEPFALPDSLPVQIDTLANELPLFLTTIDSQGPELRTTEMLSNQRVRLRFSEAVSLEGELELAAVDSASGRMIDAYAYQSEASSSDVFAWSEAPLPPGTYSLKKRSSDSTDIVSDSLGNVNEGPIQFSFESAPPDTVRVRFHAFEPAATDGITRYLNDVRAVFSVPPNTAPPNIQLFVRPEGGDPTQPAERTMRGTDRLLGPEPGVDFEDEFQVEVHLPDTTYTASFIQMTSEDLGGIVGRVVDTRATVVVRGENGDIRSTLSEPDGTFSIQRLQPGAYTVLLYIDRNANGRWDGGRFRPYESPEPIRHLPQAVTVRARWDSDLEDVRFDETLTMPEGVPPEGEQPTIEE